MILRSAGSGDALRVNRQFAERLGLTNEDLAARPFLEWIHPEDRESLQRALDAGAGCAMARHATKLGQWLPFGWRVKTDAGRVVALGLLHDRFDVAADPTDASPSPRSATLAETLRSMALIVEAKNPGLRCSILLIDSEHEHIRGGAGPSLPDAYNSAVEGLRIGPMVGSCGTAAFWNVPVVVENIAEDPLWKDLRDAAKLAGVGACWSHPVTTSQGGVLGAMALYNDEPRAPTQRQMDALEIAARMVGLAVERDRLEEQVRRSAKLKALGVLAGGIAHDFNNLLSAVLGNAEMGLEALTEDSPARQYLQAIVTASESATDLCDQMLAYAGRGLVTTEPVECNELVNELGGLLKVALSKKATLIHDLVDAPLCVLADRGQLRQVIMNLITNASEAIGNAEGRIVIATRARTLTRDDLDARHPSDNLQPGEYVQIRVSDTGVGMNTETRARLFDPFFTTKATGRGLGLAAVQGIVRGHDGAIAMDSAPGRGTVFTVLLPRSAEPCDCLPSLADAESEPHHECVLVVDDEDLVREVHGEILESAGYEVLYARDGQDAVEVFQREGDRIDCVLMDLSMPRLDGEESFRELRKIQSDVRVILITGYAEQATFDRLKDTGFAGFIKKPAKVPDLLAKVAEVLSRSAATPS
ncbi:MAG: response regulator [Planctomycetota bacterium]|jgi:signal transduction histidine kinase/CheY-like chemotaxis protein